MRIFILSILMCLSAAGMAQTAQELTGNWQFYTIKTRPGTKKSQYDGATSIMGSMMMQLNADKSYTINMMGMTEKGQWEVKNKEIVFTVGTGKSYAFTIIAFEKNLLTIDQEKFTTVLSRVGADVPPPPSFKEEKIYAKVTSAQVSKKWYLKQCPAPANMTDKQKEAFGEMLSGSYVELKANGKCTMQLGDKTENGQWQLNQNSNGITTTLKNLPKEINFTKLTASDLVAEDPAKGEEWVFSTIE
jgi:hypothetical protein